MSQNASLCHGNVMMIIIAEVLAVSAKCRGTTFYVGRNMKTSRAGMGITENDYAASHPNLTAALDKFKKRPARGEVMAFIATPESEMVEK
jgi:hypothetical protein